ncbi:tRNA (adenine(22)-N(1))-methyltransferase [Marinilactibacillus kalidii]|uniref:tRNA (adenine(22)-N(1))-methyltransferase n=1 Tax=Marinilactibacillus kalidii TaxID=2820274 RepID=UPI001ABE87C0|nr:tRNA (adenine(22)-N(1))-methyltransferase TrmK [Marinilactibacillus kalidii]
MESIQLSKRLKRVASYIPNNARLADIGSDHAYLPCSLALKGDLEFAIAGEVVKGPYDKALNEVQSRNLEEVIEVRFGDGLEVIESSDHIDTITICGMGGALIRDILTRGLSLNKLNRTETLILQPNVGEKTLRTFLMSEQYKIVAEEIIEENDKIYEIIVAIPVEEDIVYSDHALTFGPYLSEQSSDTFKKKWEQVLDKLAYVKNQMNKSQHPDERKLEKINQEIEHIKETIQ